MGGTYRHQALIDSPVEDVWAVVSDPRTHPEWWPDVVDVQLDEPLVDVANELDQVMECGRGFRSKLAHGSHVRFER